MLNLSQLPTAADMRLTKAVPRRDGAGISWDLELALSLISDADAELIDPFVPGARRVYNARESSKGEAKTTGGFDIVRAAFRSLDDAPIATGHAEIRSVSCRAAKQDAVLILRLRVHGLLSHAAIRLVDSLDEAVSLTLSSSGGAQDAPAPQTAAAQLVGRLIVTDTGSGVIAGIVSAAVGDAVFVETMEDAEPVSVDPAVDSVISITMSDDDSLGVMISAYRSACADAGVSASWHDVVTALGVAYAESAASPAGGSWELSPAVWASALAIARESKNGDLDDVFGVPV